MSKPMVQVSVTNFHFVKPGLIVGVNGALVISSHRSRHSSWPALNVGSQDLLAELRETT